MEGYRGARTGAEKHRRIEGHGEGIEEHEGAWREHRWGMEGAQRAMEGV